MNKKITILILLLISFSVFVGIYMSQQKTIDFSGLKYSGEPDVKYVSKKERNDLINEFNRELGVIEHLVAQALKKDEEALNKLIDLSLKSDGAIFESILISIIDVFNKETPFFFMVMSKQDEEVQIKIYKSIISYEDNLNIVQYSKYGKASEKFLEVYKKYKDNQ